MKTLLITGASGQLGKAIQKVYENNPEYELVLTAGHSDAYETLDIANADEVNTIVQRVKPYAIINCAAMTAVDACETETELAEAVNAIGPKNLATAARAVGARLVHVSTDYVFEGNGTRPYLETDPTNPISAYGISKHRGEEFVRDILPEHYIVRTAWLYGDGKNFVKTMLRVGKNREMVSVVDDQVGSPTSAKELAQAIAALIETDEFGTFHATCEGICSWAEFTSYFYRLAGYTTKVNYISSEQYKEMNPGSADRPHYSVLENAHLKECGIYEFATWQSAIEEYIAHLNLETL